MSNGRNNIKFTIIICTYNREKLLPLALNSIIEQTLQKKHFEVIIVDNNSTDSTPEICSDFATRNPEINFLYSTEKKQGLSHARNRGILEAKGEILTFMDDDALLSPDFSEQCLRFFDQHPLVNASGGIILLHFMDKKPYWFNPFLSSLLGYFNPGKKEKPFRRKYFRGSNMSFRRIIFKQHKPFNTDLGRVGKNMAGSEEKEIFYRLQSAGEQIWFTPKVVVHHLVPEERCGTDFIRRQGIGAGQSQRRMVRLMGQKALLMSIIQELFKWVISFLIALFYLITFRPLIATVILKFRFWISSGLFSRTS